MISMQYLQCIYKYIICINVYNFNFIVIYKFIIGLSVKYRNNMFTISNILIYNYFFILDNFILECLF